jgi:CheY-like chemotaxis protein
VSKNKEFTILIVDDEDDIIEMLSFDFKKNGYKVLTAANGKAAFEIVNKQKVDVVITDVQMPEWTGLKLLTEIRGVNPHLPLVFFITGFSLISIEEAYDKGVEALFSKPFNRGALLEAVAKGLNAMGPNRTTKMRRENASLPFTFSVGQTNVAGKVTNLGMAGVFVEVPKALLPATGQIVNFDLRADEFHYHIRGQGVVRWIREDISETLPTGFGMDLVEFTKGSRVHFLELMNSLRTKTHISQGRTKV